MTISAILLLKYATFEGFLKKIRPKQAHFYSTWDIYMWLYVAVVYERGVSYKVLLVIHLGYSLA